MIAAPTACPICAASELELAFRWQQPPAGETSFELGAEYEREFWRCRLCGHFSAAVAIDPASLYSGQYVDEVYGDGLLERFERIVALPAERSDNAQRVARIGSRLGGGDGRALLDVGSGLSVFGARMKDEGWSCTALDPDQRAVAHAREQVGIEAIHGTLESADRLGRYELISFNKVIEHVADPVAMLARGARHLADGGVAYIEVPDGETAAVAGGAAREEFFIEHLHAFSLASLCLCAAGAGIVVDEAGRVTDPSGKYTLYAFGRADAAR